MSTILEYLVLTLGLTCIIIGVGGWLLPYLQRLRQRGWSLGHDPDDDDPEVRGLTELTPTRRGAAGLDAPVARVPLWPPPATAASNDLPAPMTIAATRALAGAPVNLEDDEEDLLADVDLEGLEDEGDAADAALADDATDATPASEVSPSPLDEPPPADDDLMSLFNEVGEISKVPDALKQAVEPVSMTELLAEAREVRRLLSSKP